MAQQQQQQQQQQYPSSTIPTIQPTLQLQQQQQPYPQHHHHHQYEYVPQPHPSYQLQPPHHQQQPLTFPYAPQYQQHHYGAVPVPGLPLTGQYPIQPPPTSAYSHHHHYSERPTSKRPREPVAADVSEAPSTKRQALGNDVLFRVVVPSSQIGKVIGKGGHRVQKVREDTKATIKIADPIARYEERVIIISSKANDGALTDAEKALLQIASLILADDGSSAQTLSVGVAAAATDPYGGVGAVVGLGSVGAAAAHVPANSVRLLIAGSQAGGLIGVSGQNIEKLRESSGASITVLAPNQLPLCASAHESDRLVQISGEVPAVLKAVEEIGVELRANPPNQVISISPTYNLSIARAAQSYMDPNAAEYLTLDMVISETMVGGLIGRSGSNIARIRTESGAMIKVFGGKGEQKHRQIQLIGTAQQVALAKQRVDEYIYTQLTQ